MATINQLRIERRAFFQEFKRALRPVDTKIEKLQRFNQRILDRTRDVPEVSEYQQLIEETQQLVELLVLVQRLLETGAAVFSVL